METETHHPLDWIDTELARLERQGLRRHRGTRTGPQSAVMTIDGQDVLNFGSNDYLAVAADPRVMEAASDSLGREGWGSGASPLLCGRSRSHAELEERLAQFEGTDSALVLPTGFAANAGTIAALVGPGDVVFTDRKNHASLLDGCRLSRADVRAYPHGDCQRLDALLASAGRHRRRLIVTDSLFSMDGDLAPLDHLADLAERHGAILMIDEAHATGVFGRLGRGVAEHLGVEHRVHVRVGTLSKALGSMGGFVAGPRGLIDWLVNRARPYVFSTASPAATAAAAIAALDIVRTEPQRREGLLSRAAEVRTRLVAQGWDVGQSASQIIPVMAGTPDAALCLAAALHRRGLWVPAIRPPTVPEGEACLRISLTCGHTPEMIQRLVDAMGELRE